MKRERGGEGGSFERLEMIVSGDASRLLPRAEF